MPNGGSDCCGTCWFNRNNDGKPGYLGASRPEMPHCTIRNVDVPDAFYTYCANHPHKNPGRIEIPIGPIFTGDSMGNREVLVPSPDTEEIRLAILRILSEIPEHPTDSYPAGPSLEQTVISQLADWKEHRAIADLERIVAFKPFKPDPASPFARDQARLVQLARQALARIRGEPAPTDGAPASRPCLFCGSEVPVFPPAKGHLVQCARCHAVLVAGHSHVLGGFDARERARFGTGLSLPADPPPCLLPPGKGSGEPRAFRCPFCRMRLLDPLPGVLRKVMCPGCDQWLIPGEITDRLAPATRANRWIILAIVLLVMLIIAMIISVFR